MEECQPRAHLSIGSRREGAMVGKHWVGVSPHLGLVQQGLWSIITGLDCRATLQGNMRQGGTSKEN